ncbi:MAG: 50S ribosomal protein L25 [Candidatus Neomarinimicrobiota bacterium]|nr:MAG: 50S ribosomal protein L25 [Candidatus Neomarinimicrobiota bacterium]
MTELVLKTEVREGLGKEANKRLRKLGIIPAVFYHKSKAQTLQVNELEFLHTIKAGNQLIELKIDGKKQKALIKDIQFHPVTEKVVHIDFQGVSMSEIVQVLVQLNFVGTPEGIKEGGLFEVHMHDIEVKCKASDIPHELDVNIEEMVIGDTIHISDLDFGDLEIVSNPEMIVAAVVVPKVYKDTEVEESEGEEGEGEGEEGSESEEESTEE